MVWNQPRSSNVVLRYLAALNGNEASTPTTPEPQSPLSRRSRSSRKSSRTAKTALTESLDLSTSSWLEGNHEETPAVSAERSRGQQQQSRQTTPNRRRRPRSPMIGSSTPRRTTDDSEDSSLTSPRNSSLESNQTVHPSRREVSPSLEEANTRGGMSFMHQGLELFLPVCAPMQTAPQQPSWEVEQQEQSPQYLATRQKNRHAHLYEASQEQVGRSADQESTITTASTQVVTNRAVDLALKRIQSIEERGTTANMHGAAAGGAATGEEAQSSQPTTGGVAGRRPQMLRKHHPTRYSFGATHHNRPPIEDKSILSFSSNESSSRATPRLIAVQPILASPAGTSSSSPAPLNRLDQHVARNRQQQLKQQQQHRGPFAVAGEASVLSKSSSVGVEIDSKRIDKSDPALKGVFSSNQHLRPPTVPEQDEYVESNRLDLSLPDLRHHQDSSALSSLPQYETRTFSTRNGSDDACLSPPSIVRTPQRPVQEQPSPDPIFCAVPTPDRSAGHDTSMSTVASSVEPSPRPSLIATKSRVQVYARAVKRLNRSWPPTATGTQEGSSEIPNADAALGEVQPVSVQSKKPVPNVVTSHPKSYQEYLLRRREPPPPPPPPPKPFSPPKSIVVSRMIMPVDSGLEDDTSQERSVARSKSMPNSVLQRGGGRSQVTAQNPGPSPKTKVSDLFLAAIASPKTPTVTSPREDGRRKASLEGVRNSTHKTLRTLLSSPQSQDDAAIDDQSVDMQSIRSAFESLQASEKIHRDESGEDEDDDNASVKSLRELYEESEVQPETGVSKMRALFEAKKAPQAKRFEESNSEVKQVFSKFETKPARSVPSSRARIVHTRQAQKTASPREARPQHTSSERIAPVEPTVAPKPAPKGPVSVADRIKNFGGKGSVSPATESKPQLGVPKTKSGSYLVRDMAKSIGERQAPVRSVSSPYRPEYSSATKKSAPSEGGVSEQVQAKVQDLLKKQPVSNRYAATKPSASRPLAKAATPPQPDVRRSIADRVTDRFSDRFAKQSEKKESQSGAPAPVTEKPSENTKSLQPERPARVPSNELPGSSTSKFGSLVDDKPAMVGEEKVLPKESPTPATPAKSLVVKPAAFKGGPASETPPPRSHVESTDGTKSSSPSIARLRERLRYFSGRLKLPPEHSVASEEVNNAEPVNATRRFANSLSNEQPLPSDTGEKAALTRYRLAHSDKDTNPSAKRHVLSAADAAESAKKNSRSSRKARQALNVSQLTAVDGEARRSVTSESGSEFSDGVTLDVSIAEVSNLTNPTALLSKGGHSVASPTPAEEEKLSEPSSKTEARRSEASSSQTSEAAAPLLAKALRSRPLSDDVSADSFFASRARMWSNPLAWGETSTREDSARLSVKPWSRGNATSVWDDGTRDEVERLSRALLRPKYDEKEPESTDVRDDSNSAEWDVHRIEASFPIMKQTSSSRPEIFEFDSEWTVFPSAPSRSRSEEPVSGTSPRTQSSTRSRTPVRTNTSKTTSAVPPKTPPSAGASSTPSTRATPITRITRSPQTPQTPRSTVEQLASVSRSQLFRRTHPNQTQSQQHKPQTPVSRTSSNRSAASSRVLSATSLPNQSQSQRHKPQTPASTANSNRSAPSSRVLSATSLPARPSRATTRAVPSALSAASSLATDASETGSNHAALMDRLRALKAARIRRAKATYGRRTLYGRHRNGSTRTMEHDEYSASTKSSTRFGGSQFAAALEVD